MKSFIEIDNSKVHQPLSLHRYPMRVFNPCSSKLLQYSRLTHKRTFIALLNKADQ